MRVASNSPNEATVIAQAKRMHPVDVIGIIRRLGIDYEERPMHPDQSGYFVRRGSRFLIGVNSRDSLQRRRFTAAHELGHYVLHRDLLNDGEHFDRLFGAAARQNPTWPFSMYNEYQANDFAADLLMPASMTSMRRRLGRSVEDIAREFGVSRSAAEIRLKNLGLL